MTERNANRNTPRAQIIVLVLGIVMVSSFANRARTATPPSGAATAAVKMEVALGNDVVAAGKTDTVLLKVGLEGVPISRESERPPVNVAIVLDRSGSMSGAKMAKAKEAALAAIDRLGPEDIVSLVTYDHTVQVLIPATKVRDRSAIRQAINGIYTGGDTALFAGVSKGAFEVRKFLAKERISRVVLVSDGLANVGPSSPAALGSLGASLMKEGISVTTVGLGHGYNEDLMVALARQSDGNHAFAENAADLARIFDHEFGDLLSVVARNISVEIRFKAGASPVRALGRDADITGNLVVSRLNQVYAKQEKYLLLEVRLPASFSGDTREIADVTLKYHDAVADKGVSIRDRAAVGYSDSQEAIAASENRGVLIAGTELWANEQNKIAVELLDKGKVDEASRILERNAAKLEASSFKYGSAKLKKRAMENRRDSKEVRKPSARTHRKTMRKAQYEQDMQMAW